MFTIDMPYVPLEDPPVVLTQAAIAGQRPYVGVRKLTPTYALKLGNGLG